MAKFADHMEKITGGVTEGYQKIENGVVEGFTGMVDKMSGVMLDEEGHLKTGKVGEAVVGAYKKVEDAFVSTFMAKDLAASSFSTTNQASTGQSFSWE